MQDMQDAHVHTHSGTEHTHTNTPTRVQIVDVTKENLFSEKDSSDYDQSQAFLATLH